MRGSLLDADLVKGKFIRLIVKSGGRTERFYDDSFKPYFYFDGPKPKDFECERVERLLNGEKKELWKVYCKTPGDVPAASEALKSKGECYEFNIPFYRRYLIDKGVVPCDGVEVDFEERNGRKFVKGIRRVEGVDFEPKAVAIDIETYNKTGISDATRDQCLMAGYADESGAGLLEHGKRGFGTEKEMLEALGGLLKEKRADLVFTYNGDEFDLPYLQERAKRTGARMRLGRDRAPVRIKRLGMRNRARLGGRVHLDVYDEIFFLNYIGAVRLERLRLEDVYKGLLGKEKQEVAKTEIWKLWEKGDPILGEYCKGDALSCFELGEYAMPLEVELARVTGSTLFDASRSTAGQHVEALLLREAFNEGELVPNKPSYAQVKWRSENPIEGAFVKVPEPGVYENIAVFDFRSLYPTIIVSHNVDPTTLNCKCCGNAHESPNGHKFCRKRKGLIPKVLGKVLETRFKIKDAEKTAKGRKKEELHARQWALKIIANSVPGTEPVVLLNPEGEIEITPIREFVDKRITDETVSETGTGEAKGWKAACFVDKKIVFKPIRKVIRHKRKNKVLQITLKSGRRIRVTEDHSLFSLNRDARVVPVSAKRLKKGDHLIIPKRFPTPCPAPKNINIIKAISKLVPDKETKDIILVTKLKEPLDVLGNSKKILRALTKNSGCSTELQKLINIRRKSIAKHAKKLKQNGFVNSKAEGNKINYCITEHGKAYLKFLETIATKMKYAGSSRHYYVKFNDVKQDVSSIADEFFKELRIGTINGHRVKAIIPINAGLMRFLGYYVSEGYSRKWKNQTGGWSYRVGLTNYDRRIHREMVELVNSLGWKAKTHGKNVNADQKIAYLLTKYVFKAGCISREKQVPQLIYNCSNKLKTEFVKTYFAGDGNYEKHAKRYRFSTNSKKLVNSLVVLLNQLGVGAVSIKHEQKSGMYRVVVNEELFEEDNVKRRIWRTFPFKIPCKLIEEEVRKLGKANYRAGLKHNITIKALKKFNEEYTIKIGESTRIKKLIEFLESDLALDEVTKIIESQNQPKHVYDLSVEEAENFIGGFGLVCLHNSFYGYTAYARSRYYSRECAESVTAWARHYIKDTIGKAEKEGFKVLYGDSVTSDRFIVLMGEDGLVRVKNIQAFFEENADKIVECGEKQVIPLSGWKTISINPVTKKTGWRSVNELIRHKTEKKVYRVNQKFGESRVTEDHSLMADAREGLVEVKPTQARGFKLAQVGIPLVAPKVREIDVFEEIKGYACKTKYKGRVKERCVKADSKFAEYGWTKRKEPVKVKRRIKVRSKEFEALCRLLAAYTAEGSSSTIETTSSRYGASIAGKREWLEEVKKDYDALFTAKANVIPSMRKIRHLEYATPKGARKKIVYKDETHKLQMMNALSAVFFKMFCGQKSNGKKLPGFIYNVPRKYQLIFLEKLLEGDGSRSVNEKLGYTREYKEKNFKYTTVSLELASGLSVLLKQLGINHSIQYRPQKKVYTLATSSAYNNRVFTRIKEEAYSGWVYDLNVEENHTFADACGQIALHNTDSLFFTFEKGGEKDLEAFRKKINDKLPGNMELELEGVFPRGIFVSKKSGVKGAKKKYALIAADGKIKIRGFELVRRDWSRVARRTQRRVLEILLKEGDAAKAADFVRGVIANLKEGKTEMRDLAVLTSLRKKTSEYLVKSPELGAVLEARKAGVDVPEGAMVEYVITKSGKTVSEKARILERAKDYDADYYVDKQVLPAVLKIIGPLGYGEADLKEGGRQTGIGAW